MTPSCMTPIYLDNQATTPVDPRVLDQMLPFFTQQFGNAASDHSWGRAALAAVDQARSEVAQLIGATPLEVVFTSGATESINLALKGLAKWPLGQRCEIITARTEHAAGMDVCSFLAATGYRIHYVPIRVNGHLDLDELAKRLSEKTLVVSLMLAHNEIGVIHDAATIGGLAHRVGAFFHCDGAQALGKISLDVDQLQIDLLSVSAHKLYGPKGVGALYVRRKEPRVRLEVLTHGGGHERGLRSGTLNVPAIVGFGAACTLARQEMAEEATRIRQLRDHLLTKLQSAGPIVNGDFDRRLPGNLNLRFPGVRASALIQACPDVAFSTASACTQLVRSPSRTLQALGLSPDQAAESVRFGIGRFNTLHEIEICSDLLLQAIAHLRANPPDVTCLL